LLNYVVAIYLVVVGIIGLNGIYHWIKQEASPPWSRSQRLPQGLAPGVLFRP
jgi:Protein of unknown function (DUF3096)